MIGQHHDTNIASLITESNSVRTEPQGKIVLNMLALVSLGAVFTIVLGVIMAALLT